MSEQNVEVVRALLEAFNKGDVDAMLGLATDDVDVQVSFRMPGQG